MRLSLKQADQRIDSRGTNTQSKFINEFYLRNDGNHNIIRILLKDIDSIELHSVHTVKMTSKNGKPYPMAVDCLGPDCPFCNAAQNYKDEKFPLVSRVRDNIYLPVIVFYDEDDNVNAEYKVFVRSTNYLRQTLIPFAKRNDISKPVEIERQGRAGETRISYNLYEAKVDFDDIDISSSKSACYELASRSLEDLMNDFEVKTDDICGRNDSLIRTWTAEQMNMFLEDPSVYPSLHQEETTEVKPRTRNNHGF